MRNNQNLAPRARFELATLRLREIGSHFSILNESGITDLLSVLSAKDFSSGMVEACRGEDSGREGWIQTPR
jgi:hypothetical protein